MHSPNLFPMSSTMPRPDAFRVNIAAQAVVVSPPLSINERPSQFPYRLTELKKLPRRLFKPPKHSQSQRVGRVRSFRLTPVYSVRLEDVLSGQHLPPLTIHEFESYLVHIEKSSENLYFLLWFNDYTAQHQAWNRTSIDSHLSPSLAYSYARAKQTFFTKSAALELNLDADVLAALSTAEPHAHPPPSSFADVRRQVEGMLTESLHNFVRSRSTNAGRNRGLFAIFVGLVVMVIGLAPILSSVLQSKSRWLRVAALPCFWFGATTLICGLHGVCIIIFLFGDARQLTAYELARPEIKHHALHFVNTTPMARSQRPYAPSLSESSKSVGDAEVPGALLEVYDTRIAAISPKAQITNFNVTAPKLRCETVTDILPLHSPLYSPASSKLHSPATIAPFISTPPPESQCNGFDFGQLFSSEPGISRSPPIFGPLTKVFDEICILTYWETVTRSAALALIIACVLVLAAVAA